MNGSETDEDEDEDGEVEGDASELTLATDEGGCGVVSVVDAENGIC